MPDPDTQTIAIKQLWKIAQDRLASIIHDAGNLQWVRNGKLMPTNSADRYILCVSSLAAERHLKKHCQTQIERVVAELMGRPIKIEIVSRVAKQTTHAPNGYVSESLFPEEADVEPDTQGPVPTADTLPPRIVRATPAKDRRVPQRAGRTRPAKVPTHSPDGAASSERKGGRSYPPTSTARATNVNGAEKPEWLNSRYTFDTFIVGGGNQFAYAASMAVADAPGTSYNPLFLYGGVGLGKTHLMHAIAHFVAPKGYRTLYVTSETFTNEIINAIRYRTTEEFRAKYRSVDILLVDDIQFIAGKDSTEEEFFHTFNALHEAQKQIVVCSDRPPKAIDLAERLRSRFEWGLIADIQPPDLETRYAILRTKAEVSGCDIPDDILSFLAERTPNNVRELEGMLNRVIAFARLQDEPMTLEMAHQALSNLDMPEQPQRHMTNAEVMVAVADYFHLTLSELAGKQRDRRIVVPRQIAMWIMRTDTGCGLSQIGNDLGGRDHTTIMHGCDRIDEELRNQNTKITHDLNALRKILAAEPGPGH